MARVEHLAEGVTLYLGDCREVLQPNGPVEWIDVVLTDPPYGINYRSGYATPSLWKSGNWITGDITLDVRDCMLQQVLEFGEPPAIVFGSHRVPEPDGTRMWLIWDKGPALGMGALDLPWKPSFEVIFVLGKGFTGHRDGGVIYCPPVQSMAKNGRVHPNEKPVELLLGLLDKCPPGIVCDPFMGSGSTGVAAVKRGRPFIGIEIEPAYFDIAVRRISDALARPDLFVAPPPPAKQEALW